MSIVIDNDCYYCLVFRNGVQKFCARYSISAPSKYTTCLFYASWQRHIWKWHHLSVSAVFICCFNYKWQSSSLKVAQLTQKTARWVIISTSISIQLDKLFSLLYKTYYVLDVLAQINFVFINITVTQFTICN